MVYIAAALLALVALLALALYRQPASFLNQIAAERAEWARERASLLDRVQHPEIRQIEPVAHAPVDPPRDPAELAHIGQIVPEFVHVGDNGHPD